MRFPVLHILAYTGTVSLFLLKSLYWGYSSISLQLGRFHSSVSAFQPKATRSALPVNKLDVLFMMVKETRSTRNNGQLSVRMLERTWCRIWALGGDLGEDVRKQVFALDWMLSQSREVLWLGVSVHVIYGQGRLEWGQSCNWYKSDHSFWLRGRVRYSVGVTGTSCLCLYKIKQGACLVSLSCSQSNLSEVTILRDYVQKENNIVWCQGMLSVFPFSPAYLLTEPNG